VEDVLLNDGGAIYTLVLPGGFEIWLAKSRARGSSASVRPRDPGATVLRLMVADVDRLVEALRQARVNVVSAGGVQTLPPAALRAAILRAPDDLLIQVVKWHRAFARG
jgi:hypothetical protein